MSKGFIFKEILKVHKESRHCWEGKFSLAGVRDLDLNGTIGSKEVNINEKVTKWCGRGDIVLLNVHTEHKDALNLTPDCTSNVSIKICLCCHSVIRAA